MNQRLQDLGVDSPDKIMFLEHFSTYVLVLNFFFQKLRSGSILKLAPACGKALNKRWWTWTHTPHRSSSLCSSAGHLGRKWWKLICGPDLPEKKRREKTVRNLSHTKLSVCLSPWLYVLFLVNSLLLIYRGSVTQNTSSYSFWLSQVSPW